MKLLWFPDAVADLDEIYDYYVTLNPRAATMLYNSILDEAEILRTHPRIAHKEPLLEDFPEEYRSLLVAEGRYKLVYYIENNYIYIVQIFAYRRNPDILKSTTIKRRQ
jgi:plasmid stabilization system protein ParE